VSRIYLIRHGQAGTRDAYDALSETGHRQASLLGEYFLTRGVRFVKACSGALSRQRQTAAAVAAACPGFPEIEPAPGWNEFDLDDIYKELAPVLCEEDPGFRFHYEAMRADRQADRRWTPADLQIVKAWVEAHPAYKGESWQAFRERIAACRTPLTGDDDRNIAIFTSATPIGIWAALSLDIEDHRAFRLAGALYNASYTVMRLRAGELRLHTFNAVPHLTPDLRTYR